MPELLEMLEPARIAYLVIGTAVFVYFAHLVLACGVAVVDGTFFGSDKTGLAVVFTGVLPHRDRISDRIMAALEQVLMRRGFFTLIAAGVPGLLFSRYVVNQWWGTQFWICCAVAVIVLFTELLTVTMVSCGEYDRPLLWPSGDSRPPNSEELRRDVRQARSDVRSWNVSRMCVFGIIAAADLFTVVLAALLLHFASG